MRDQNSLEHYGVKGMKWKKKKPSLAGGGGVNSSSEEPTKNTGRSTSSNDNDPTKANPFTKILREGKKKKEQKSKITKPSGKKRVSSINAGKTAKRGQEAIAKMFGK